MGALSRYGLDWWIDLLLPVCRELRRSVERKPDLDFWQCICMPKEVYYGEFITGWITRFFPYVAGTGRDRHQEGAIAPAVQRRNEGLDPWREGGWNPEFEIPFKHQRAPENPRNMWSGPRSLPEPPQHRRKWLCRGIPLREFPLGLSYAPVQVADGAGRVRAETTLVSGFIGVTQASDLALQAHVGWGVVEGSNALRRVDEWF